MYVSMAAPAVIRISGVNPVGRHLALPFWLVRFSGWSFEPQNSKQSFRWACHLVQGIRLGLLFMVIVFSATDLFIPQAVLKICLCV